MNIENRQAHGGLAFVRQQSGEAHPSPPCGHRDSCAGPARKSKGGVTPHVCRSLCAGFELHAQLAHDLGHSCWASPHGLMGGGVRAGITRMLTEGGRSAHAQRRLHCC
jgi:hypothetical protein